MIYTGLGRVGEIADVKAHGGADVAEVYGGIGESNPIFYSRKTLTGTSPLTFKGLGQPLKDYHIYGDTLQDGTPTPGAPVDVVGCGVRTGNLLSEKYENRSINGAGAFTIDNNYDLWIGEVVAGQTYAISNMDYVYGFFTTKPLPNTGATYDGSRGYEISGTAVVTVPSGCTWIAVRVLHSADDAMLNLGSSALPYEPYGYKLPITVNITEHPIYLGEVETTRRIKKLVLTGEENITLHNVRNDIAGVRIPTPTLVAADSPLICSHAINVSMNTYFFMRSYNVVAVSDTAGLENVYMSAPDDEHNTLSGIKSYLAQQYAAGTPVTVWYVLAEPETGIVNEPIHMIGDYADSISYAQAGVTIPTIAGRNVLTIGTPVQPSAVSITGNIKPTGYGQLLDSQDVEIYDKYSTPIHIHG